MWDPTAHFQEEISPNVKRYQVVVDERRQNLEKALQNLYYR